MGKITAIDDIKGVQAREKKVNKREIGIADMSRKKISITLWEDLSELIDADAISKSNVPVIIIITSTMVGRYMGKLSLSTTASSKVYIDLNTEEVTQFKQRLGGAKQEITCFRSSEINDLRGDQDNGKTIKEILNFIKNEHQQDATFTTVATITSVNISTGWSYLGCTCKKKLTIIGSKYKCESCDKEVEFPILRYRIQANAEDDTGSTTFIIFDKEAEKIIKILVTQLRDMQQKAEDDDIMPIGIKNLAERTYLFRIKVSKFNFSALQQSFSVSKIFEDENMDLSQKIQEASTKRVDTEKSPELFSPAKRARLDMEDGEKQD